ncbi:MAG: rhomboid family intramembrane serine protease [Halobacteriales archaeon]|nr:rhomboid family intramembrane serine protease [Halobacteriales archaeon]
MATCDVCGRQEDMPYTCHYCGGSHCAEHRLPENHNCSGLDEWDDPSGVFDSGFGGSASDTGGRESAFPSAGPGGLLGYFRGNATYLFLALMWVTFFLQLIVRQFVSRSLHETLFVLSSAHPEFVWTWVTAVFAHGGFGHILINSIVLYFFGPIVERRVGTRAFVLLFLGSGVLAGLAQIGTALAVGEISGVVGASGAIMAIMGVLTVLNPQLKVYLYFILPVPLWLLTVGFAGYSVFIVLGGGIGSGGVAHLAHLVGLVVGLGYGERLRREGTDVPTELQFGGGRRGGPGRRF